MAISRQYVINLLPFLQSPWDSNRATDRPYARETITERKRKMGKGKTNLCEVKADRPVWAREMADNG